MGPVVLSQPEPVLLSVTTVLLIDRSHTSVLALPVELLFEIIRQSISLPAFLEVDHIPEVTNPFIPLAAYQAIRFDNEKVYWQVERHINVLRRVCKSFDAYLRRFEHRFVRIADVYHGDV
jgi:hypothetical protein